MVVRLRFEDNNLAMEAASKRGRKESILKDKDAVCKAWKDARLEPKPYFVTLSTKSLDGVLSCDTSSQKFSFKRLRFPVTHPLSSFEVEGLTFCRHQGVFNIHNRTWHAIPQAPEESKYRPAIGMMVDTNARPYSFKLVMGSVDKKTQIYDSKTGSWSTRASKVMQVAKSALNSPKPVSCVCTEGCVYVSIGVEILLVYSMEADKWATLNSPKVKQEKGGCALGSWNGRIFTTREDFEEKNLTLWELVDQTRQEWAEYAVMSKPHYDLVRGSQKNGVCLSPCFCDGYLLIYNSQFFSAVAMLDLSTKKWKQADLGTEGGPEDEEEKGSGDEEEDGSEDEGGEGEGSEGEEGGSEDEDEGSEGKEGTSDDGDEGDVEEGIEDEQGEDEEAEEEDGDGSDDNGDEEDDVDSSEDEDEE